MQTNEEIDSFKLVRAAQEGDAAAFEVLVSTHYDQMFRHACRFLGNREDAEDVTQQACMKLARSIAQFRFESAFSTWLYRLVTNCGRDYLRNQVRQGARPVMDDGAETRSQDASDWIQLEDVLKQVAGFGEGFRETIVLVLAEGLTHKEAALVLGVKESTVSWRLHEVRKRLAAMEVQS